MKKINLIIIGIFLFNFISIASVSALDIGVHVPEKYAEIMAGERFYFEVEIKYPENPSRKDLRLEYEIRTKDGEFVAQSKVIKAVETQTSFIDYLIIPDDVESGFYTIKIRIRDYENLDEEIGASFHIISGSSLQIRIYFFILLGAAILIGILVAFNIAIGERKS